MNEHLIKKRLWKGIFFTSILGILLFTISVIIIFFLTNSLNKVTFEQMHRESQEYKSRLLEQVDHNFQTLHTVGAFFENDNLLDSKHFAQNLYNSNQKNDFEVMGYFPKGQNGTIATLNKGVQTNIDPKSLNIEAQNTLKQAFAGKDVYSNLYQSEPGADLIFVQAIPIYQNKKVTGVLIANDSIDIFSDVIETDSVLNGTGFFHLLNSDGEFLIRSSHAVVKKKIHTIFSQNYFSKEEDASIQKALKKNQTVSTSFRYHGKKYQAVLEPVGINHWYLFCVNTSSGASSSSFQLVKVIAFAFIFVMILCILLLSFCFRLIRRNNKELHFFAYHDILTGADNSIAFTQKLSAQLDDEKYGCIASLNIHQFKFINEIFGKESANSLLCHIKKILDEELSSDEFFCRDSADLFYIFLQESNRRNVQKRFERIMDKINIEFINHHNNYRISVYIGIVMCKDFEQYGNLNAHNLITSSHFALLTAKTSISGKIAFYNKDIHVHEELENYIETHMHHALENNEFKMFLQPKIDLKTGKIAGAEALVRWIREDGTLIFPDQFIPLFEENGFCIQLDMFMLETACRQIRLWIDRGLAPIPISVNQSKHVFFQADYLQRLNDLIQKYQISANLITLEILEGLALENARQLNTVIHQLQSIGFRISMDDFGAGYSSLNTLGNLAIDELKLDRSFLLAASKEQTSRFRIIMKQIFQISKQLHINTIVEGVETDEHEDFIRELGSDYAQGYFYSPPISVFEFEKQYPLKRL